jgi:hypothetical protein
VDSAGAEDSGGVSIDGGVDSVGMVSAGGVDSGGMVSAGGGVDSAGAEDSGGVLSAGAAVSSAFGPQADNISEPARTTARVAGAINVLRIFIQMLLLWVVSAQRRRGDMEYCRGWSQRKAPQPACPVRM